MILDILNSEFVSYFDIRISYLHNTPAKRLLFSPISEPNPQTLITFAKST